MGRFNIEIDETRIFRHTLTVEAESEEELDSILTDLECEDTPMDVDAYCYGLSQRNCKVIENSIDENGDLDEIECVDIEEMD
ncbi:UNVERIFIED_ORG: hypothetical protein B2H98_17005 [Clostridium botulinum]